MGCNSSVESRSTESTCHDISTNDPKNAQFNVETNKPNGYSTPMKPNPIVIETPRQMSLDSAELEGPTKGVRFIGVLNNKNKFFIPSTENYFLDRIKIEKILIDHQTVSTILPMKESAQSFKLSVLYPSTVVNPLNQYYWSIAERKDNSSLCLVITPRNQADLFKAKLMSDTKILAYPTFLMREIRFALCSEDIDYICNSEVLESFEFYHQEKLKKHNAWELHIPRGDIAIIGQNILTRFVTVSFDRFMYFIEAHDKLKLDMSELKNLNSLFSRECRIPRGYLNWESLNNTAVSGAGFECEDEPYPFNPAFLGGEKPLTPNKTPTSGKLLSMKRSNSSPLKGKESPRVVSVQKSQSSDATSSTSKFDFSIKSVDVVTEGGALSTIDRLDNNL